MLVRRIGRILKNIVYNNRRVLVVSCHIGLVVAAYYFSYLLRFEFSVSPGDLTVFFKTLWFCAGIKLIVYYFFGLYAGLWRYVSVEDLWQILKANTISTVLFVLAVVFSFGLTGFPRSVFVLDWWLCVGFMAGIRFASRVIQKKIQPSGNRKRKVLVIGAGEAGALIVRESRNNPDMCFEAVGFIDDDPSKRGMSVHGIRVLGGRALIPEMVVRRKVEEIVIAIPSASGEVIRGILPFCEVPGVRVKIIPRLDKFLSGELEIKPKDVSPEDLLGREAVEIDLEEIRGYLKNKRVLVTGAGGSIGSELCRQIARFGPERIVLFDHNENDVYFLVVEFKTKYPSVNFKTVIGDIRDVGLLKSVFSRYKPQVVFHAAAHKHVPLMEENAAATVKNNIIGSRNLIYAANHYRVERFVLISTDKAVNPTSVMGMSKRIVEMILQAKAPRSKTKFMAVRFGNVLGSAGSVVPLFKKQIEQGGPVTVTHPDVERYFMSVGEASSLVLQAGALGQGGEIFVLDMGEPIRIVDIAKNLIGLSGLKLDKDISIEFVGLRPGEKLTEDLLLSAERDRLTRHEKIYSARAGHFNHLKLRFEVKELERLSRTMSEDKIVQKMKEMIAGAV
jgi:FlaA1/EpsC-like NDP-sugar epimerase